MQNIEIEMLNFNEFLLERKSTGYAAGVTLIYQNKILLVHPTGSSWKRGTCGIPKGGMESHEEPIDTAIRELFEETGITISLDQLDPVQYVVDIIGRHGAWQLVYFLCKIEELEEIGLTSEKIPSSQLQLEEVDWAKFVSPEEAYPIMTRSQLIILDRHLSLNKVK